MPQGAASGWKTAMEREWRAKSLQWAAMRCGGQNFKLSEL